MKYSNETNDLLITMSENNGLDKSLFPIDVLHRLFDDGFVRYSSDHHDNNLYLTDKGKAYVEQLQTDHKDKRHRIIHDWVNTVIAIDSLIVAIIALIVSLMR